jgi:predicted metal-binding protein
MREILENKNPYRVQVKEASIDSETVLVYEQFEMTIPTAQFDQAQKYKLACEACPQQGKNFSCPPYSPTFQEYLGGLKTARVICIRIPQEVFHFLPAEKRYRRCFLKARDLLVKELVDYREKGFRVAGSGACQACTVCAIQEGFENCQKPDQRIYSLESLGTNLIALTKRCFDFELEWNSQDHSADFVCSIGAVFYDF